MKNLGHVQVFQRSATLGVRNAVDLTILEGFLSVKRHCSFVVRVHLEDQPTTAKLPRFGLALSEHVPANSAPAQSLHDRDASEIEIPLLRSDQSRARQPDPLLQFPVQLEMIQLRNCQSRQHAAAEQIFSRKAGHHCNYAPLTDQDAAKRGTEFTQPPFK